MSTSTTGWAAYMERLDQPCSTCWRVALAANVPVRSMAAWTRFEHGLRVYACHDCKNNDKETRP